MSRIRLLTLTVPELELYLREDFSFEDHFHLERHPRKVDENSGKKLREVILPKIQSDPENIQFYTLWVAVDTTINTAVAGIVFKGPPNENKEVELGAGTFEGFMNRGYMTETTRMMCEWTKKRDPEINIIATCSTQNFASQRTLEKSGFVVVEKAEEYWKWLYQPQRR